MAEYTVYLQEYEKDYLDENPNSFAYPLKKEQLDFLDEHGYLVIKNLIEKETCNKIVEEAFDRMKQIYSLDKEEEATWGVIPFHGVADVWHLPSLYQVRQDPRIFSIFCQLLKTPNLVCSVDRVGMKPPCRDGFATNENLALHTDLNFWYADLDQPQYQGGLCLEDAPSGVGGFYCIPGFNKRERIDEYMKNCEAGNFDSKGKVWKKPLQKQVFIIYTDQEDANKNKMEIPLEQGDYVIWSNYLPHAGGKNTNPDKWRLQAFVRYVSLDGPCVGKYSGPQNKNYKNCIAKSSLTGEKPSHFSTGNAVKSSQETTQLEVPFHDLEKIGFSDLGKKVFHHTNANIKKYLQN